MHFLYVSELFNSSLAFLCFNLTLFTFTGQFIRVHLPCAVLDPHLP